MKTLRFLAFLVAGLLSGMVVVPTLMGGAVIVFCLTFNPRTVEWWCDALEREWATQLRRVRG